MTYVMGIDPGPVVGIAVIGFDPRVEPTIAQCSWNAFDDVLLALGGRSALAVEQFVIGRLTARANDPGANRAARAVIDRCQHYAREHALLCYLRSAATVKPWATDERLAAAGLLAPTKGMPHARDAARHALFTAVAEFGRPDPLSKAARRD